MESVDLSNCSTFKIGCMSEKVFVPYSLEEFMEILIENPDITLIGAGSNVLISSFGLEKPVVLTKKLNNFTFIEDKLTAQCGVKTSLLANEALKRERTGLEFLSCIPATIGGAVFMNASAHGQGISDIILEVTAFDRVSKRPITLLKNQMELGYRKSIFQKGNLIILGASFKLEKLYREVISHKMEQNQNYRKEKQPSLKTPNVGSIFKNPEGSSAGKLIEDAGLKGYSVGNAQVSPIHANFIINEGGATSMDVLKLMKVIQDTVFKKTEIKLYPEVKYIGNNKEEEQIWQKLNN